MRTLIELVDEFSELGEREALRYHNGYRTWRYSYAELHARIAAFADYLDQAGIGKGQRLLLWGANRPEWVTVFWGCVARGVEVVPLDLHSTPDFVLRVQRQVEARLAVVGDLSGVRQAGSETELPIPSLSFQDVAELPPIRSIDATEVAEDDVVEIVYTSGTTGTPKGVVHRHRNICANLTPIAAEARRYRSFARPFQPIRLMNMLPLSHMFGQAAGLFFPVLFQGAVVLNDEYRAESMIETIRRERVSVLITVPRLLRNLRSHLVRKFGIDPKASRFRKWAGAAETWWRYRALHRKFGLKFWCFVCGGAPLDADLEKFWQRLGWVVVQGYGLTESSPVVAINHPLKARAGSIGKPIEGQHVKLAPDGEILVSGASVASDYYGSDETSSSRVERGWLHTGDIGALDDEGRLYYRGRKKDMIVTPEGLNVFPSDVEEILNADPQVRESIVIGLARNGEERIHAVLIADQDADLAAVVARANERLEPHQRMQGWSSWPEDDFPRTPSTHKVKRHEVVQRIAAAATGAPSTRISGVRGALADLTGREPSDLQPHVRLEEDLALTSLQRMELLSRLESELGMTLGENEFSALRTVAELEAAIGETRAVRPVQPSAGGADAPPAARQALSNHETVEPRVFTPRWSRSFPVRWGRRATVDGLLMPLMRQMIRLSVEGRTNLDKAKPPLIFIANHLSHFDTACIVASLPHRWKKLLAPAMSQDWFRAYLDPQGESWRERWLLGLQLYLAVGLFNAYPLPQKMGGARRALRYTGELLGQGYCPLVFPEGWRSTDGKMAPFKPGIGLIARQMKAPILPIRITGTFEVLSAHDKWPKPGRVTVRFGPPLAYREGESIEQTARRLEQAVRNLGQKSEA